MLKNSSLNIIILFSSICLSQPVFINEFLASNTTNYPEIIDFDDYTDWIELYNSSNVPYTLNGYFITDDFENPLKWKIPDGTIINPEGYMIIWADDYNEIPGKIYTRPYWPWDEFITQNYHTNFKLSKSGEELGLFMADQGESVLLIENGSLWKFLDNGTNQGSSWIDIDFDDDSWNTGYAELGYGDGDETTIVGYGNEENNKHITTYFRHQFIVNNTENIQNLTLFLKRDDGAVIYLNGNELLRSNMPSEQIEFDTFASVAAPPETEDLFYSWSLPNEFLQDGQNIIAVELHQVNQTSSDISFDLELVGTSYYNYVLVDSISFENQIQDISYGKNIEDDYWSFFGEPTPGKPNDTYPASSFDTSSEVEFSLPSGFYNGTQIIELSTDQISEQIYYTLDGSKPSTGAILYIDPIIIENTAIIRARSIDMNKLPGKINASTYFINEQSNLTSLSLIVDPYLLWDNEIGIYENEFKQREIPITIQYFNEQEEHSFTINAGARLGGLNIWTKPQKPFTIYTRDRFGDDYIDYQLFKNKQIAKFSRIVLRNGGDDWEETLIRDPMTESIITGQMNCGYMAYNPTALFLNGSYWGLHNIREKFDKQYFFENFNVEPDNLDHLEYISNTQLVVIEGTKNNYQALINYILNNNINDIEVYDQIQEQMNVDSFIDHIIMTVYCANTSWGHNREWWRSQGENGKWNWLIVDLDRGFNINNLSRNLLADLMEEYELFNFLLNSDFFRNRFIQRSAAHLNNTFHPDRITNIVDSLSNMISAEMPNHINKWGDEGGVSSINTWQNELDDIKQFADSRTDFVFDQFINDLNVEGTVQIVIEVEPPEAGKIIINEVPLIKQNTEGKYFINTPISITAKPFPGYHFVGWEGLTNNENIIYNCNSDSTFKAVFQLSEELLLPNIISVNTTLINEQPYVITQDLIIESGSSLTIGEGVEIRVIEEKNIIVNGQLIVNGTETNPVKIKRHESIGENRWGAICFNNSNDSSFISNLKIVGASTGLDPGLHHGAISSINSNIVLNRIEIEDVIFPIFVSGGSVHMKESSIECEYICDFINVKGGDGIVENCSFFGSSAQDTDAIDFDDVTNGIIRNNRIYHFSGFNSDGIDIGENSENILIDSNLIYHARDKGISVGQNSSTIIRKNLIIGSNHGVAIKDNSESYIINNTFFNNDTSVSSYEKNEGEGGGIVQIVNSILSNSAFTSTFVDEFSELSVKFSLSNTELLSGEGNLFLDPLFLDQDIYNLELNPNSPCIDAGNPNHPLDEDGSISDIGAYYIHSSDHYPFEFSSQFTNQLKINELLAVNDAINTDEVGEFDDWIEIYNPTNEPVNISRLFLTDNLNNLNKWQFPYTDEIIPSGGYLIVWCDDDESQGIFHTNFKLSSDGEFLALVKEDGITIIDSISFSSQIADQSYGRIPDGGEEWDLLSPSPGNSNLELNLEDFNNMPSFYKLSQNYPNPFNPITLIQFDLPEDELVNIEIHDMMGRIVKTLVNSAQTAGYKSIKWNATNDRNDPVSTGLYFYTIQAGEFRQTKKMVLLK